MELDPVQAVRVALIGACLAGNAGAGELRLVNGAVIPGELKRVEAAHIVWQAELVGELRVEKAAVLSFGSSATQTVRIGTSGPVLKDCRVQVAEQRAAMDCEGAAPQDHPFASLRPAPSTSIDTGKITIALNLDRGEQASEDELDIDARASRRRGNRRHSVEGSIDYEQNATRATEDEAELLYQGDLIQRDGWYLFGGAEYRRDRQAAIQESMLMGAGVGQEWDPYEDLNLRLQAGLYEARINLAERGKEMTELGAVRWFATWKAPWMRAVLSHEGQFGAVFEETDINLLETSTAVSVPFAGGWLGELRLEYDRYGISEDGSPKSEIEWIFGLGYRW